MKENEWEEWTTLVNLFIKRYCGEYVPHLLDSDENDGQRLRDFISQEKERSRNEAIDECVNALPNPIEPLPGDGNMGKLYVEGVNLMLEDCKESLLNLKKN